MTLRTLKARRLPPLLTDVSTVLTLVTVFAAMGPPARTQLVFQVLSTLGNTSIRLSGVRSAVFLPFIWSAYFISLRS